MIRLTRDQRKALKAVYDRAPIRAEGSSTMNLTYRTASPARSCATAPSAWRGWVCSC